METHTVIERNHQHNHQDHGITWKELHGLDFSFNSAFRLKLSDHQELIASKILRLIPQKRLVVLGQWQGKAVVAKLFFSATSAKRHMEKDAAGIKKLQEYNIPTPLLYFQGKSKDQRVYVLIFECIAASNNLETICQEIDSLAKLQQTLELVIKEIATQHVFGILQKDLHLKNYLVTEKTIYTLDGGDIEVFPGLLPKKQSIDNLALFLSQLGVGNETLQEQLFYYYAKLRGWLLKTEDKQELFNAIKKWSTYRWSRYEKKIFRNSTSFSVTNHWFMKGISARENAGPEFAAFLLHPELAFIHPTARILKSGRSATVVQLRLDCRDIVVKRYNIKNVWHFLRRCFRITRAQSSWHLAHKLVLFGMKTAKPLAFIENKFLGFSGKSYYVTEYIRGKHIGDFIQAHNDQNDLLNQIVYKTSALLKNLAKLSVTHGDLKKTNILVDQNNQPVLIDLDGAVEHLSVSSLHRAWHDEIRRFLDNFAQQKQLLDQFKKELYG